MSDPLFTRLLTAKDVIAKGDRFFKSATHSWDEFKDSYIGCPYDPSSMNPGSRRVELTATGKVKDVVKAKKVEKQFDLRKLKKEKHMLVQIGVEIKKFKFEPKRMSPKKDYVCLMVDVCGSGTWFKTDVIEKCIVEYL